MHGNAEPRRLDSAFSPTDGVQSSQACLHPAGFLFHLCKYAG
jgi:hypothetical protein